MLKRAGAAVDKTAQEDKLPAKRSDGKVFKSPLDDLERRNQGAF